MTVLNSCEHMKRPLNMWNHLFFHGMFHFINNPDHHKSSIFNGIFHNRYNKQSILLMGFFVHSAAHWLQHQAALGFVMDLANFRWDALAHVEDLPFQRFQRFRPHEKGDRTKRYTRWAYDNGCILCYCNQEKCWRHGIPSWFMTCNCGIHEVYERSTFHHWGTHLVGLKVWKYGAIKIVSHGGMDSLQ